MQVTFTLDLTPERYQNLLSLLAETNPIPAPKKPGRPRKVETTTELTPSKLAEAMADEAEEVRPEDEPWVAGALPGAHLLQDDPEPVPAETEEPEVEETPEPQPVAEVAPAPVTFAELKELAKAFSIRSSRDRMIEIFKEHGFKGFSEVEKHPEKYEVFKKIFEEE